MATTSTNRITQHHSSRQHQTERAVILIMVVLMAVLSFWLASNRTLDPGYLQPNEAFNTDFYRQQAIAMLDGRLDVPYDPNDWNECFFRDDRCYGYPGLTPSLLRLPGFAVGLSTAFNPSPLIVAAGAAVALWAAIQLALGVAAARPPDRQLSDRSRLWLIVMVGALLGPGGLLTFLSQAKIYYEAIIWMVAGLLVCITYVHRWSSSRRPVHLVIALVGAVVAANARPTSLLATFIIGLGVIALAARDPSRPGRQSVLLGAAIATAPLVAALGVFLLKLRTVTPEFASYVYFDSAWMQRILQANDGHLQGLRFVPTSIVNFLRPDTLAFGGPWPGVRHALPLEKSAITIAPVTSEGLYVEFAASLTNTMPVALLLTVGFAVLVVAGKAHMTRGERATYLVTMVATATVIAATVVQFALTTRYLGDFFPLLAVGTVWALVWLAQATAGRPDVQRWVGTGLVATAVVTFWINQSLQQQSFTISG